MGDIIEPLGIEFKNPLPLLWGHKSDKPVGLATFDTPTEEGITFEATIATINEPGILKDRTDEAWQSLNAGLVRGASIGFRSIERAKLKNDGIRFLKRSCRAFACRCSCKFRSNDSSRSLNRCRGAGRVRPQEHRGKFIPPASRVSSTVVKAQEARMATAEENHCRTSSSFRSNAPSESRAHDGNHGSRRRASGHAR